MRPVVRVPLALFALAAVLLTALPARAQNNAPLCFPNVPGITNCIQGRFLEYWRANGGLATFGYPLTGEWEQQTSEGEFTVQYFERQRFELHPENARPFDVLLGRLGDEILLRQGRVWQNEPVPTGLPGDVCERMEPTRHVVCGEFLIYWVFQRLDITSSTPAKRDQSLRLYGLPLTERADERNPDGDLVPTQWFERSRFEFHVDNPPQFQVLLGRLGAEALDRVERTVGGISDGHDAAARTIRIESQRDGGITVVSYTAATPIVCEGGAAPPAGILDRPELRLFVDGVYASNGVLGARRITVFCG